jgi:hypothetical protein
MDCLFLKFLFVECTGLMSILISEPVIRLVISETLGPSLLYLNERVDLHLWRGFVSH